MAAPGNLALDGGDPRRPSANVVDQRETQTVIAHASGHKLHDPNVPFEEYMYYASISRSDERYENPNHDFSFFGKVLKKGTRQTGPPGFQHQGGTAGIDHNGNANSNQLVSGDGENGHIDSPGAPAHGGRLVINDQDYVNAFSFFGKVLKKGTRQTGPPGFQHQGGTAGIDHNGNANHSDQLVSGNGEKGGENGHIDSPDAPAHGGRFVINDQDYVNASRAVRSATWGAVFYLITTDILGPFSTPWAFAAMGYVPGVVLFTIFGFMAGYGGFLLWHLFLALDSDRYPLKTYGDIAFRIYGSAARHTINVIQSVQLLFNVGIIIIVNGLSLVQVITGANANAYSCFIVLCFVWAVSGMIFGQIRTLQKLGWLSNLAIWLNLFVIFMTMGIVANSGVNDAAAIASNTVLGIVEGQPISTSVGARPGTSFTTQINGLMQAVYSYGGAMLFVEFMSEMKRPFDFWKGMVCAQLFIYFFYMLFGLFVYSYQGQYVINPAYQGINPYKWQTAANSIGLVTSIIAALLYGNIGIKVIYNNLLMDLFGFPGLGTKAGKLLWVGIAPIYWGLAFIIAAAVPQVSNLSGLIAAACILQFSYTFPPFFMVGYMAKKHAMLPGDGFDPATGLVSRQDGGFARFKRGFLSHPLFNSFNVLVVLGSAVTAILGIYAAIVGIKAVYAANPGTSFSCKNPYA